MPPRRRQFRRPLGERRYKKLFLVAVEGAKTEPQYFGILNDQLSIVKVFCLKANKGSSPLHVLRRMEGHLKEEGLRKTDEAWLVVDKDEWTDDQLSQLYNWSQKHSNHGLALSNPSFEYWLLLHFEDGNGVAGRRDCQYRLREYLPGYDKSVDPRLITRSMVEDAIRRAKKHDNPPCADWPRTIGTTVYRLVENILGA